MPPAEAATATYRHLSLILPTPLLILMLCSITSTKNSAAAAYCRPSPPASAYRCRRLSQIAVASRRQPSLPISTAAGCRVSPLLLPQLTVTCRYCGRCIGLPQPTVSTSCCCFPLLPLPPTTASRCRFLSPVAAYCQHRIRSLMPDARKPPLLLTANSRHCCRCF